MTNILWVLINEQTIECILLIIVVVGIFEWHAYIYSHYFEYITVDLMFYVRSLILIGIYIIIRFDSYQSGPTRMEHR